MKNSIAFLCLMIPVMVACAAEPEPSPGPGAEESAAPAAPTSPTADRPISALADEPCLNYCTGGGRTPFMTCVPVCRKDLKVYFPPEPVKLQILPTCGDNICQLPDELNRDSDRYCPHDCRLRVEVTRTRLTIGGKIIAEAEGENLLLRASAFDAEL